MRTARAALGWMVLSVVACGGDDDAPPGDGGAARDAPIDAPAIEPPMPDPPAPPALTPCPAGWRELDVRGIAACDPFPEGGRIECAEGSAHFPGEPGCTTVGRSCPSGPFADDLPAGTLYVQQGASGGDGSRDAPFGTIVEAVGVASGDATIAVGPGTFTEPVRVDAGRVTLRGACTAMTTLERPVGATQSVRVGAGATAVVEDVTFRGAGAGVVHTFGGDLTLRGVVVRDGSVQATEGSLSLEGVDVGIQSGISAFDPLVIASNGDRFAMRRAIVHRGGSTGIEVSNMAETTIEDVAVDDMASYGIAVYGDTPVFIRRALVLRARGTAILTTTSATLEDVVIVEPLSDLGDADGGLGLGLFGGITSSLSRVRIERVLAVGMLAADGAHVTASDVLIHETGTTLSLTQPGRGIELGLRATLSADRVAVLAVGDIGVLASSNASIDGRDLSILDVLPNTNGTWGRALHVQTGARATLERALIERAHEAAITASGSGSSIECTSCNIRETMMRGCAETSCPESSAGIGAAAIAEGSIRLQRFRLSRAALCGLQIASGGGADLADGVVEQNPIGVNVQTSPFDVARVTSNVVYRDNGTNLDTLDLPVPDATVR